MRERRFPRLIGVTLAAVLAAAIWRGLITLFDVLVLRR